ncbi:MAG: hypothetical protein KKA79_04750 [Nanoarchaeota archaeon]|nr:hypothetical protein [Nanoarchaeota archaeon]MCG2717855.1 hypothetical protein [Nanoarchaeota archaeon]
MKDHKTLSKELEEITGASKELIENIIKKSNEQGILYHGIRSKRKLEERAEKGIVPSTPEKLRGNKSEGETTYFATGTRFFYPLQDSPLFAYSGGSNRDEPEKTRLHMAQTSLEKLAEYGIYVFPDFEPDKVFNINSTIPREAFSLIEIIIDHPQDGKFREYRKIGEQILLEKINELIKEPFKSGRRINVYKSIK